MQHCLVVFNNISGRPIISIFKGQAVQEEIIYFILKTYDILKVKNAIVKYVLPYKVQHLQFGIKRPCSLSSQIFSLKHTFTLNNTGYSQSINVCMHLFSITGTYLGPVLSLCMERRGTQQSSTNIDNHLVLLKFLLPLNEIVVDFHDQLKSVSSGYASFDYEEYGFVPSKLVKVSSNVHCFKIKNTQFLSLGNARTIPERIMYFVTREHIIASTFQVAQSVKSLAMALIVKYIFLQ